MSEIPAGKPAAPPGPEPAPRWGAPAVPPPWGFPGQPWPAQTWQGQTWQGQPWTARWYGTPPGARDKARWLGTFVVAAIIAVVTLGGFFIDSTLAAPSAGDVSIGQGLSMTASSGWVLTDSQPRTGVELQKGDVVMDAEADALAGSPASVLADQERALRSGVASISFGTRKESPIGGHPTALVDFTAIVTGSFGSGTIDGELICLTIDDRTVIVLAYAPRGDLNASAGDVISMIESIRPGR